MNALHDLYTYTSGYQWQWLPVEDGYGVPWAFVPDANPCAEQWQGLNCTTNAAANTSHIVSIVLPYYGLKGSLLNTLGDLTRLQYVDVGYNHLVGTLPNIFSALHDLQYGYFWYNRMTGTLPSGIGNAENLIYVFLNANRFNGTIPCEWLSLTNLQLLRVDNNLLTGTIPSCVVASVNLGNFGLSYNLLSGTIPSAMFDLPVLYFVYMDNNYLTGTVPHTFAGAYELSAVSFGNNQFTGPLPAYGNQPYMEGITVYQNWFTGTIPVAIANCWRAGYFEVQDNLLSGTLPPEVGGMQNLLVLYTGFNYLTGSVPSTFGNLTRLSYLHMSNSLLSGRLPSLAAIPVMYDLEIEHNLFSGDLSGFLDPVRQPALSVVLVNNNQLTGTLPDDLFQTSSLTVFTANVNCFHGSIPEALCAARAMSSLVLDGLRSARACRALRFAGSYSVGDRIYGTIPQCLFQLPNLTSLHLSGNALTGSLPSDLDLSHSLYDLTLSHNVLTGRIPTQIQERKFYTLDLSYNRLSGTLVPQFGTQDFNFTFFVDVTDGLRDLFFELYNSSAPGYFNLSMRRESIQREVLLNNNRLSGKLPGSVTTLQHVDVLRANMFTCKLDGSDLPAHNSGRDNYQCGSSAFDVPYYIWLVVFAALTAAAAVAYRHSLKLEALGLSLATLAQWFTFNHTALQSRRGLVQLLDLLHLVCKLALGVSAATLVALLPLYCILSTHYGEFTYEYAWTVSAAFLSGRAPAALEFSAWVLLLAGVAYVVLSTIHRLYDSAGTDATVRRSRIMSLSVQQLSLNSSILIYTVYALVNLVVVVGVNIVYVYVAIYETSSLLIFAQVVLSLFKLTWSSVCTSEILRLTTQYVARTTTGSTHVYSEANFASVQVFVALLNSIVIPCCVVAIISPNCFYDAFVAAPTVVSDFFYVECVEINTDLTCERSLPTKGRTYFDPPFIYSYQCSSSMITYYAPTFVNLAIISTFLAPAAQLLNLYLYNRAAPGGRWHAVLRYFLPRLLVPAATVASGTASKGETTAVVAGHAVYNANRLVSNIAMFVGVLLTFGVVFPPLSAALAMTVVSVANYEKAKIGHFAHAALELTAPHLLDALDADCRALGSVPLLLYNTLWMLLTVCCGFYTLFLFDTLGDAVGLAGAYWVLIVMPLMPLCLYFCFAYIERHWDVPHLSTSGRGAAVDKDNGNAGDLEMHAVTINPLTVTPIKE
jgi:Leucine-rich repeat (LRR) protein